MTLTALSRLAGATALTLSLAACMDVDMTIDVLSTSDAEATMVTTVGPDIYAMIEAQAEEGDEEFCSEGELTETGTEVLCTVTQSGAFADLDFGDEETGPTITEVGGGQVRVAFPTGDLSEQVASDAGVADDPQMLAMITSLFEGHSITMTVTGGRIVDTNMNLSPTGDSASFEIPFVDLLTGGAELPDELFAVVQK